VRNLKVVWAMLLAGFFSSAVMAQDSIQTVPLAKLSGHVQDRAGANLAGADVSVKIGSHEIAHASTDGNGVFSFDGDAGTYDVSIQLAKYAPVKSAMVTFKAGKAETIVMKAEGSPSEGLEYGVFVQGGNGLTENEGGFHFVMVGGHAGKILTPDVGPGILKGNFEYAVEVIPFWQSYTPKMQRQMCTPVSSTTDSCSAPYTVGGTFTGASITPMILRWNFAGGTKWKPWIQGAGGVIWTNHKFPAFGGPPASATAGTVSSTAVGNNVASDDTSVWNFTPQFGIGAHYFLKPKRSIDFSANAVHISSASLGDKNPGVNASVQVSIGYSWWK